MMIAIVDYGVGNLFSLASSLKAIGAEIVVSGEKKVLHEAEKIILPGVGAFRDARAKLAKNNLDEFLIAEAKSGKPFLGICLGMQMMFEKSYEYGEYEGLGLLKGKVVPIKDCLTDKSLKVPHIGWNALEIVRDNPLLKYVKNGDFVYFVHSYYVADCAESLLAVTDYSCPLTAAAAKDNIYACQFHPEKSGAVGFNILRAFNEI